MNYVIMAEGAHLSKPRYMHQSGLLVADVVAAERLEFEQANKILIDNQPDTKCTLTVVEFKKALHDSLFK